VRGDPPHVAADDALIRYRGIHYRKIEDIMARDIALKRTAGLGSNRQGNGSQLFYDVFLWTASSLAS
jgi:hypothetical protein